MVSSADYEMHSNDHLFVLGIDLNHYSMVNAMLVVQNLYATIMEEDEAEEY